MPPGAWKLASGSGASGDPLLQVGGVGADGGVVAVAGVHERVGWQGEELRADALDDRREAREAAAGGARSALEAGVGAEHHAGRLVVEADPAGSVARRVEHDEVVPARGEHVAVLEAGVPRAAGVPGAPQPGAARLEER